MTSRRNERDTEAVGGVWTLAGDRMIIASEQGPATILVPSEAVLLLAVDLPLASRAKRLEALPFAVEDRIADPIDTVHLALGAEIAPRRYLVGVVRHVLMEAWIDRADAAGVGGAALVPDALALPTPPEGAWAVELAADRALVRADDGTGFAVPAALLLPAWTAAGKPPALAYGLPLPAEMQLAAEQLQPQALAERLLSPALDLRQGRYARRRSVSRFARRLGWIVGLGALAHAGIAAADTLMLHVIAERREADTRALVAQTAPGTGLGSDVAASVVDLLPPPGTGATARQSSFLPLVARVSGALTPLSPTIATRAIRFEGNVLTIELDATAPDLRPRVADALRAAGVDASVTPAAGGALHIVARS